MKEFRGMDPKVKERGPKKQARTIDKKATTRAVLKEQTCFCGGTLPGCDGRAATGHHVLGKGSPHFGDDVPENLAPASGSGTTGCHGKFHAGDKATRRALGVYLKDKRPDTVFYVLEKLGDTPGRDWLKRRLYLTV